MRVVKIRTLSGSSGRILALLIDALVDFLATTVTVTTVGFCEQREQAETALIDSARGQAKGSGMKHL